MLDTTNPDRWTHTVATMLPHLVQAYPEEGCGLILECDGDFRFLPTKNLANRYHQLDPDSFPRTAETFYIIDPTEFMRAEERGERVAAVVHSHCDVGDYFSDEDVRGALFSGDDDDPEPSHPGVDWLVVSVRDGQADYASVFRFEAGHERHFALVYRFHVDRPDVGLQT